MLTLTDEELLEDLVEMNSIYSLIIFLEMKKINQNILKIKFLLYIPYYYTMNLINR